MVGTRNCRGKRRSLLRWGEDHGGLHHCRRTRPFSRQGVYLDSPCTGSTLSRCEPSVEVQTDSKTDGRCGVTVGDHGVLSFYRKTIRQKDDVLIFSELAPKLLHFSGLVEERGLWRWVPRGSPFVPTFCRGLTSIVNNGPCFLSSSLSSSSPYPLPPTPLSLQHSLHYHCSHRDFSPSHRCYTLAEGLRFLEVFPWSPTQFLLRSVADVSVTTVTLSRPPWFTPVSRILHRYLRNVWTI